MDSKEKREQLHQILDLVLDVNEFEERRKIDTGDKPTVFMRFSGHVCRLDVEVHENGWESFNNNKDVKQYKAYLSPGSCGCADSLESIIASLDAIQRKERQKGFKQCAGI